MRIHPPIRPGLISFFSNTYTNKTWSDVSRISLSEINQMEKEFLNGLNHNLYVDLATYESWVRMLSGLIDA